MAENKKIIGVQVDLVPEQIQLMNQFRVKDWTRFNVAVPVDNATTTENKVDPALLDVLYETDVDVNGSQLAATSLEDEIASRLRGSREQFAGVASGPLSVGFEGIVATSSVW